MEESGSGNSKEIGNIESVFEVKIREETIVLFLKRILENKKILTLKLF